MSLIHIDTISKSFKDLVLDNVSGKVNKGEIVTILGPSGSGKSTLLRCLNMLTRPDKGHIHIFDEDITKKHFNIQKLRSRVGMVFQHFHLFPHFNVLENIIYSPMNVKKITKDLAIDKAFMLLERIGLKEKAYERPCHLSGGQKQRVAIARCLAMEPEIILFDEPTSALDPEMVKEVLDVIKSCVSTNKTILIVTHEMAFAREISHTIWFMDKGQIIEKNTPQDFFKSPNQPRAKLFLEKVL